MDWKLHGSSIYKLTVPADVANGSWVWSIVPGTTGAVPALTGQDRCYGRFNIVPMGTGAVAVCMYSTTNKPWVFKIA
jgi:hypothetical protein